MLAIELFEKFKDKQENRLLAISDDRQNNF